LTGRGRRPCLVVGYDGSEHAREALSYAIARVGKRGRLMIVFGYGSTPDLLALRHPEHLVEDSEEYGRGVLDGILLDGNEELLDVDHEMELVASTPAKAIDEVAREQDAEKIVVGSRGFGLVRTAALGSVSHELLHLADRPVVVVPRPSRHSR